MTIKNETPVAGDVYVWGPTLYGGGMTHLWMFPTRELADHFINSVAPETGGKYYILKLEDTRQMPAKSKTARLHDCVEAGCLINGVPAKAAALGHNG